MKDLIQQFFGYLENKHKEKVEVTNNTIRVESTGSMITIIPMGLPNDKELSEVGISKYTMEDFVVKLVFIE